MPASRRPSIGEILSIVAPPPRHSPSNTPALSSVRPSFSRGVFINKRLLSFGAERRISDHFFNVVPAAYTCGCCSQLSLRSSQLGFICSTRAIFLLRRQPLSFFSHATPSLTLRKCLSQTSRFRW